MKEIIDRAIDICWDNRSLATPNPTVYACVISPEGHVVSEGMTSPYPGAHAEPDALSKAGDQARGAILFVTLEPCCHHGKNPPCTDAIIQAGIKKVIYAIADPFLGGKGIETLHQAGIETMQIPNPEPFYEIYQGFFQRVTTEQPYIIHKLAMTADGGFHHPDDQTGNRPTWITGEEARRDVHVWRARSCAILTSMKSISDDQSNLDVRMGINAPRQPDIIALTRSEDAYNHDIHRLKSAHVDRAIHLIHEQDIETFKLLKQTLTELKINNLFIEIGAQMSWAMIHARLADEYHIYTLAQNYRDIPLYQELLSHYETVSVVPCGSDLKITLKKK